MTSQTNSARPTNVVHVGTCTACQKRARLVDHACAECRSTFGPHCGKIFRLVRRDRTFALICFLLLRSESARAAFIEWFGDPRPDPNCQHD